MLSFATEFPVRRDVTADSFGIAVKKWLIGSPHTSIKEGELSSIGELGNFSFAKGIERVSTMRASRAQDDWYCVRYKRFDSDLEWTTTVGFSASGSDSWVSIRIYCESTHPAVRVPLAKKPVLVRTLLEALGGGNDGDLAVTDSAHRLDQTQIDLASRLIVGDGNCRLPVVYVSSRFNGGHSLDCGRLANALAGMAHVVVEPNRAFSQRLQIETNSQNVYGGTIGIYWPDGGGRRSFFLSKETERPGDLAKEIFEEIRVALTNRRPFDRCTWASAQEMVARARYEELKSRGSAEIKEYIDAFDDELESHRQKLEDAEREIARLRSEITRYQAKSASQVGLAIKTGTEQDLYPNEIANIVVDSFRHYLAATPEHSRRRHIVEALIGANPRNDEDEIARERVKELLRGFRELDPRTKRGLEELGFTISSDGKHTKLIYRGDGRYTVVLPKTGSDHRGGLNAAADINRLVY